MANEWMKTAVKQLRHERLAVTGGLNVTTNVSDFVNAELPLSHGRDTLHVCGRRGRMSRGKKEGERSAGPSRKNHRVSPSGLGHEIHLMILI